jgi:hypothetical protein
MWRFGCAFHYKTYGSGNFPWRQALSQITNTLGRLIEFQYDSSGNLISAPAICSVIRPTG